MVYGWREGAKWGLFAPLYSLAGPQNRTYFDLSDSFSRQFVNKVAALLRDSAPDEDSVKCFTRGWRQDRGEIRDSLRI